MSHFLSDEEDNEDENEEDLQIQQRRLQELVQEVMKAVQPRADERLSTQLKAIFEITKAQNIELRAEVTALKEANQEHWAAAQSMSLRINRLETQLSMILLKKQQQRVEEDEKKRKTSRHKTVRVAKELEDTTPSSPVCAVPEKPAPARTRTEEPKTSVTNKTSKVKEPELKNTETKVAEFQRDVDTLRPGRFSQFIKSEKSDHDDRGSNIQDSQGRNNQLPIFIPESCKRKKSISNEERSRELKERKKFLETPRVNTCNRRSMKSMEFFELL